MHLTRSLTSCYLCLQEDGASSNRPIASLEGHFSMPDLPGLNLHSHGPHALNYRKMSNRTCSESRIRNGPTETTFSPFSRHLAFSFFPVSCSRSLLSPLSYFLTLPLSVFLILSHNHSIFSLSHFLSLSCFFHVSCSCSRSLP